MPELYSFDTINGYNIAVEPLSDGQYQGVCYLTSPDEPRHIIYGSDGELVRRTLINAVNNDT